MNRKRAPLPFHFIAVSVLAWLLLLSGCHNPDPYPPYAEAPTPPAGSGSAAGSLEFSAPVVEFFTDGPQQASPSAYGRLSSIPAVGIFLAGYKRPAATLSTTPADLVDLGDGQWRLNFDISGLAMGDFVLSQYSSQGGYYEGEQSWIEIGQQVKFTLSQAAPRATGLALSFGQGGDAAGGELGGKILLGGNSASGSTLNLGLYPGSQYNQFTTTNPAWQFAMPSSATGRVFYHISRIGAQEVGIAVYAWGAVSSTGSVRLRIDGQPSLGGIIDLPGDGAAPQAGLYLTLFGNYDNATADEAAAQHGRISGRIKLTGALNWESDLIVVAEDISGAAPALNSRAVRYLLPEDIGLGGVLTAELAWLRPGTYKVEVFRLGGSNTDPPVRLGGATADVPLPLPPLAYYENLPGDRYYYQPEPAASVDFELDLPEGI